MRLIDADALLYDLEIAPLTGDGGVDVNDLDDIIKRQPTIEERKTGRWDCSDDMYETAICSACGWDTTDPWSHIRHWFNYCPNCGADMRGEKDEL